MSAEIVVKRSKRICPIFLRWADMAPWTCLRWQFWSVRHHVSPFQCLRMIPSSVSISYFRRMVLAGLILHLSTSTQSQDDLVQSRRPRPRAESPKKATRAAEADEHENGRSWALIPSTGAGQHTCMLFNLQKCFLGKKVTLQATQPCSR